MGKRMKVLGARRTTVIVTLAVLLLAVAVVIGSGANFNATAVNADNTFTAGQLTLTSTNTVTFDTELMVPGQTKSGEFELLNSGNVDGALSLTPVIDLVSSTGLQDALEVRVYDAAVSPAGVPWTPLTVASGVPVSAGTLEHGVARTFVVEVHFIDSGPDGADNAYMSDVAVFDITWEIVSVP